MKRNVFFLIVLLAMLLSGCGSAGKNMQLPAISPELKTEIETAWSEGARIIDMWYGDGTEIQWYDESDENTWAEGLRYYGSFGGAEALYHAGASSGYKTSGVEIDPGCLIYRDGVIYSIAMAFDEGAVTKEELTQIAEYHKQYSLQSDRAKVYVVEGVDGVTALDTKLQKKVEKAWWEAKNCELGWTVKKGPRYYGSFNGTVVIFIEGMIAAEQTVVIDGVAIKHKCGFAMYVYKDGEIIKDLKEAYEKGWLTKENVQTIADYHELYETKRYK